MTYNARDRESKSGKVVLEELSRISAVIYLFFQILNPSLIVTPECWSLF